MRKKYEIPDVPAKLSNRTSMKQGSAGQITRVDTVMMQHWHLLILQRAPAFFWTQHILAPSALYQLHPPPPSPLSVIACQVAAVIIGDGAAQLFASSSTSAKTYIHNIQCFAGTANVNECRYWFPKVLAASKRTLHTEIGIICIIVRCSWTVRLEVSNRGQNLDR